MRTPGDLACPHVAGVVCFKQDHCDDCTTRDNDVKERDAYVQKIERLMTLIRPEQRTLVMDKWCVHCGNEAIEPRGLCEACEGAL